MIIRILQTLLLSNMLVLNVLLAISQAQITLDGSLGSQGSLLGPHYRINAELGQIRGSNLFHSFGQFNVPTGGSATFAGPDTIANILSRVTGGQPSAVDGLLRSEMAGANLFLLNPSGVLFGPNARLHVSGSFHVSTADVLRFADGSTFSANLGQASVLTVASPRAFGFLGSNPAPITMQGSTLQVPDGKTVSVVGGDITIVGNGPLTIESVPTLWARSGRIQLGSVASPGEVAFSPLELALDLPVDSVTRLGRLALSQGAFLDTSGNGGGTVLLRGGHLWMDGSAVFADNQGPVDGTGPGVDVWLAGDAIITNGSLINTDRSSTGRGRDLQIVAGRVHIDDSGIGSRGSKAGNGGNILLNARALTLTRGAQLISDTSGSGQAGNVTVMATDMISIAGRGRLGPSGVFSNTFGGGDAGRITISAPVVQIDNGLIQALADDESQGNAGNIEVQVGQLTLTGGAQISSGTFGIGRGGDLTVTATDGIAIAGHDRDGNPSGLFSATLGGGPGGDLRVTAPHLQLSDGGTIAASSLGASNAGNISIQAGQLFLRDDSAVTTQSNQGDGGNIQLTAGSLVNLRDSRITAMVFSGMGKGGNITIDLPSVVLERSQISANAFGGPGGSVQIMADVLLQSPEMPESTITASSTLGVQGTVDIQVPVTSLSGALAPLPQVFVDIATLLPARCATRLSEGTFSSLVLGGREGLPLGPDGLLPSPLTLDEHLLVDPAGTEAPLQQKSTAKFAFLTLADKAFPRIRGTHLPGGEIATLDRGCPN